MKAKPKKPAPTLKRARGRPSKFEAVFDEHKEKIRVFTEKGLTDEEICQLFGITTQTYYNWKASNQEFFDAIKGWKATADKEVERSLYERACGYSHPETKPQWVVDHWEYAEMIKHYPPDPTSMIFWLKNRQPDKWRDKHDLDLMDNRMVQLILESLPPDVAEGVRLAIKAKGKK